MWAGGIVSYPVTWWHLLPVHPTSSLQTLGRGCLLEDSGVLIGPFLWIVLWDGRLRVVRKVEGSDMEIVILAKSLIELQWIVEQIYQIAFHFYQTEILLIRTGKDISLRS